MDEARLVHAGGDHELIDAAEALERGVEHRLGVVERCPAGARCVSTSPPTSRTSAATSSSSLLRAGGEQQLAAERAQRDARSRARTRRTRR